MIVSEEQLLSPLLKNDPGLSIGVLRAYAMHLYYLNQEVIKSGGIEALRPLCIPSFFEKKVAFLAGRNTGAVSGPDVSSVRINGWKQVSGWDEISVVLSVRGPEAEGPNSGAVPSAYKNETLVLMRVAGTQSTGLEGGLVGKCSACGAPMSITPEGNCTYCGSNLLGGQFTWLWAAHTTANGITAL